MKQTLPWNVTGIPPEAREVARAAALREGMSVGDWLTRRILVESVRTMAPPAVEDDEPGPSYRHARDEETRRDRDDLAVKLARSEAESDSAIRRIDEALRAMARRLETSERSQNEAHRAMSSAASEINAATRDQAQAFQHLTTRIERVERHADTSALRDAVRGLHQGLSRLADQIAKTASESTGQITTLASNVEVLAGKIATARDESKHLGQFVEEQLVALGERVKQNEERIASSTQLEERLKHIEERLASSSRVEERLSHVETRIASSRLEENLGKLEARVNSAEERMQEALGRHLAAIERNLEHIGARLERAEQRDQSDGGIQEALCGLSARFDAAENKNRDAFAGLKASLGETARRIEGFETAMPFGGPLSPPLPPFGDPLSQPLPGPLASDLDLPPFADAPPYPSGGYSPPRPGETFHAVPPPETSESFVPEQQPVHPSAENYLAQARRAAQATAEPDADRAKRSRYRMRIPAEGTHRTSPEGERKKANHIPRPVAVAALILLVLAAGFLMTRNAGPRPEVVALAPSTQVAQVPPSAAEPAAAGAFPEPTPISGIRSSALNGVDAASPPAPPAAQAAQAPASAPQRVASATPPRNAAPPAAGSAATSATPAAAPAANAAATPLASLTAQANGGDVKAALALGLKYADGDGVPTNDSEAARWLQKAAERGEPVAQYRLGTLYEKGRGVGADPRQAMRWYSEAARRGNRKAMHNLAVAYADGAGAEKNFTEAVRWFKAAAELGLTDSQFNLAVLYERGMGVPASLAEAYKWYAIATATGDAESKARVDALATQIQPAERDAADRAAKTYRPQAMNLAANDE